MVDLICCGAINWDISLFVERLPRRGEEVEVRSIQRVSGGTAANVAVASARILGPGRVAFIGALGGDEIAVRQLAILRDEGVETSGVLRVPGEESGQAYITIGPEGENEIHTFFGANLALAPERLLEPDRLRLIGEAKVAVIMDPPPPSARLLAELCAERGVTAVWDPGVYSGMGLGALRDTLRNVDYFTLNQVEFEGLLGTSDPLEVGRRLEAVKGGIRAIIKRGGEGAALYGDGEVIEVEALPLGTMGMRVVNTVGCGDAFIGAFAAAKVEGLGDREALRWGCAAGSYKATRMETRGGPTRRQLMELLRAWELLKG
jgi:ribokinase